MSTSEPHVTYNHTTDIVRHHGWIVASLYWITEAASWLSLGHWFRVAPRLFPKPAFVDADRHKVKPWWQDSVSAVYLLATIGALQLATHPSPSLACLGSWLSAYILYDPFVYLVRVLWFDDLKPSIPDPRRGVWSHRRIALLSILAYIQAIVLFPAVYRLDPNLASVPPDMLSARAFAAATSFSTPTPSSPLDGVLVVFSIFLVAIAITTTVSLAYRRNEFAPKPRDQEGEAT